MKYWKGSILSLFMGMLVCAPISLKAQTAMQFRHAPVLCTVQEQPMAVSFDIFASTPPVEARVYFKSSQVNSYYFVQATKDASGRYTAILPPPTPETTIIDYLLLSVNQQGQAVKTSRFSVPVDVEKSCPQYRRMQSSAKIVVSAEQVIPVEIGFAGKEVAWEMTSDAKPLFEAAKETMVLTDTPAEQDGEAKVAKQSGGWGKKTLLGLGLGAGAAAGAAVALSSGGDNSGDDGDSWDSVGNQAKNVSAQVTKTPAVQTSCGTSVVNQLTIRNDNASAILLGTIDYQVVLTKDRPTGSCVAGRSGSFAPDGVDTVAPGQTVLVREWANEVNPCGNCPYVSAECVWESRYVIHTSVGSAVARSTFSTQGNLCGSSSAKIIGLPPQISPDVEP